MQWHMHSTFNTSINKAEETSPWTFPLGLVHGPLCGSGLWTTPVDLPYL